MRQVISSKRLDLAAKPGIGQDSDERLEPGRLHEETKAQELIALSRDRDELELERAGRGKDTDSHVGRPSRDGGGDRRVREHLAFEPVYINRPHARALQQVIEQKPRPGALLAVDKRNARPCEVLYSFDPLRVPGGHHQALGPLAHVHKENVFGRNLAQYISCLLYTSDAADDLLCVDLGGRRIIKKKK